MPTRINWHVVQARREIQERLDRALTAVALQIEAQAKVEITNNGQVDTGFLRTSGYTVAPNTNTFNQVEPGGMKTSKATGASVRRDRAPRPVQPKPGEAVVGFAADYAVYQETRNSFLHRAGEMVRGQEAERAIASSIR